MIRISQWFGENPDYYQQFNLPGHDGVDFVVPVGTEVYAAHAGTITRVSTGGNLGTQIRILHKDGYQSGYAHLSQSLVNEGQNVISGELIGYSGNTGNSTGPHLHFFEKQDTPYTDENGTVWPYNLRDPWPHLYHLYQEWLDTNGISGYVYQSSTVSDMQGQYARALGRLNVRESASSNAPLLGTVPKYGIMKILGNVVNGYIPVVTPVEQPAQGSNPAIGLHLRADPGNALPGEWGEMARLASSPTPRVIKLLHAHPRENYTQAITHLGANAAYIVRVFQSWGGRNITPEQFVQWTKDDLLDRVTLLQSNGISNVYVELHNEPNLTMEGLGYSWQNGTEFMTWATRVIQLYEPLLPSVIWVYPGLSPGGDISGIRADSTRFFQESLSQLGMFDDVGVHAYWSDGFPIEQAIGHVDTVRSMTNKSIWITECSRNDRPATQPATIYGKEYADFVKMLRGRGGMSGVTYYVGSASDPNFEPETWVTESNQVKGIAQSLIDNLR